MYLNGSVVRVTTVDDDSVGLSLNVSIFVFGTPFWLRFRVHFTKVVFWYIRIL